MGYATSEKFRAESRIRLPRHLLRLHDACPGFSVRLQHSSSILRVNDNGELESSHVQRPDGRHDPQQRTVRSRRNPLPTPKPRPGHHNALPEPLRLRFRTSYVSFSSSTNPRHRNPHRYSNNPLFISILAFAANRNLKYVAVTVIVFLILISSILLGYLGHFTPE